MNLNEVLEALECDEDEPVPDTITIFPPENCTGGVTDEDSGDENVVTLQNLPGSQLRAEAEITGYDSSDDGDEGDDYISLAQLAKRPRMDDPVPTTSSQNVYPALFPLQGTTTSVSKNKTYTWRSRDIEPVHKIWNNMQVAQLKQNPVYFFDCLFDDAIIEMIVDYTNLYATQKNKEGNVTVREMKCFIGILLYSGYVVVPRRYMFWENASDCGMPIVFNSLSRDRFTYIMSHLHCSDNSNLKTDDKFAKMRPLFDKLNAKFLAYAPYEENHSIDEAMIPCYGGHPCKQCHKNAMFFCVKCSVSLHPKVCFETYHTLAE